MKSILTFCLSLFFLLLSPSVFAQEVTVIHAGKLLAKPGEGVLAEQTVVVEKGKIKSVQKGYYWRSAKQYRRE